MSLEDILMRGRWASTKSARHYIQAGPALLLSVAVPPKMARWGATLSRHLLRAFAVPPPQSHSVKGGANRSTLLEP